MQISAGASAQYIIPRSAIDGNNYDFRGKLDDVDYASTSSCVDSLEALCVETVYGELKNLEG